MLTGHLPIENWHERIGYPAIADAILDRLIHNAHRIKLNGGKSIPFVPYDQSKEFNPSDVLGIYSRSLMQQAEVKKAAIKAE
ncbi:MAG: hypothetical protein FJ117_01180 [Deltaproteobacteria bacterium]|nr:hypothetical protein [Deltaproteobacteria bacterium]